MACKGNNLAHKGNYSRTLMGHLQARASSNHYSLVRPKFLTSQSSFYNQVLKPITQQMDLENDPNIGNPGVQICYL